MAFTMITLSHAQFIVNGAPAAGSLGIALSEPMTNGGVTYSIIPPGVAVLTGGGLSVKLPATDDPGTTTHSGNPAVYTFTLRLNGDVVQPGPPPQTIATALTSGAVGAAIDWNQLPLVQGVPPVQPSSSSGVIYGGNASTV